MAYERVLSVFCKHDQDASGIIDRPDLGAVLQHLNPWWTDARIDCALREADVDMQQIDYALWLQWVFDYSSRRQVLVRYVSGELAFSGNSVAPETPVSDLIRTISGQTGTSEDSGRLCSNDLLLRRGSSLGDYMSPTEEGPVELTFLRMVGPPVTPHALSGRNIRLTEQPLRVGSRCHFDRAYTFISLGDFADNPMMRYVRTSNNDKSTPEDKLMWELEVHMPVKIYLNFRSEGHVTDTGVSVWLEHFGWELSQMASTVSTGYPNGPYSGPVYSRTVDSGVVELWGSNCDEGCYFVFIEII